MVEFLNFNGKIIEALVCDVYDGDSIHVIFDLHDHPYKWKCRLSGVDTPEIRNKDRDVKKYGIIVRDMLRKKILGKNITVRCGEFDKYGRLLVTPIDNGENICQWLIQNNYAKPYDGGRKKNWTTLDIPS